MRTLIVLFAAAVPAAACMNDSELSSHEREFRSSYGAPVEPPKSASSYRVPSGVYYAGGAALLIGGFVAAVRPRKPV